MTESNYVRYDQSQLQSDPPPSIREIEQKLGTFEYCQLSDGQWCIRTIPAKDETPMAVFGKNLDAAAQRLLVILRLQSI